LIFTLPSHFIPIFGDISPSRHRLSSARRSTMTDRRYPRIALMALLAGGVALAGCSSDKPRTATPAHGTTTTTASTTRTAAAPSGTATTAPKTRTGTVTTSGGKPLPTSTGVPACDDYLSSYMACHAVAGIYTPDQIQSHYDDMRTSLLQDSVNPNTRPELSGRCTAMAKQLREALHGRSCAASNAPSPATTTTH
jgi:hypothetical protein